MLFNIFVTSLARSESFLILSSDSINWSTSFHPSYHRAQKEGQQVLEEAKEEIVEPIYKAIDEMIRGRRR